MSDGHEKSDKLALFLNKKLKATEKEYTENKNPPINLNSVVPAFLLVISSIAMFLETLICILIPIIEKNSYMQKLFKFIFNYFINIIEMGFLVSKMFSNTISDENYKMIGDTYNANYKKIEISMTPLLDIFYEVNKAEIEKDLSPKEDTAEEVAEEVAEEDEN